MHLKYIKQVILKILFMLGLCNLKFSLKIPCPPLTKLLPTIQYNTPGTPEPPHPSPQIFFFFGGGGGRSSILSFGKASVVSK